ncbi:MAG: TonB-dependent receptor plug domain-containing protein, partial [Psychrosphaera sp.]|nr:TonB-dependent receptor plug domain-containing protein [Psychrosphaera sp.]
MKPTTIIFLLLLFTPSIYAEDDDMDDLGDISLENLLNIVITTASKTALSAEKAPGIVSVVTQAEITKMGARTLADVLETVPGITVGASLQAGFHKAIYVRGGHSFLSEDVLILKDGVRLNDGFTGGGMTMSPDYPVDNIKQVEIIRGPGSALYGANGFIGVINIITADAQGSNMSFRARAGDSSGKQFSASFNYEHSDDLRWRLFLSYDNDDFKGLGVADTVYLGVFEHSNYQSADHNEIVTAEIKLKYKTVQLSVDNMNMEVTNNWGMGVPQDTYTDILGIQTDLNTDELRNYSDGGNYGLSAKYNHPFSDTLIMDLTVAQRVYNSNFWYMLGNNFDNNFSSVDGGFASGFGIEVNLDNFSTDVGFTW